MAVEISNDALFFGVVTAAFFVDVGVALFVPIVAVGSDVFLTLTLSWTSGT